MNCMLRHFSTVSLIVLCWLAISCTNQPAETSPGTSPSNTHLTQDTSEENAAHSTTTPSAPDNTQAKIEAEYAELPKTVVTKTLPFFQKNTKDLSDIIERGYIRILIPENEEGLLVRDGMPVAKDIELAESFARSIKAEPIFISVKNYDEFIPKLLDGSGDIIAAQLSVTKERDEQIDFAQSTFSVSEVLIGRKNAKIKPKKIEDLENQTIHVRASSSYYQTLQKYITKKKLTNIKVVEAPKHIDTIELIQDVSAGDIDFTVADSHIFEASKTYAPHTVSYFALAENQPIAWGVRPGNPDLRARINKFQTQLAIGSTIDAIYKGDVDGIKKRGVLRVITRNNPITYFLHRGRTYGFEYELMNMFAESLGVRLQMVIPPSRDKLIPWLQEGKGDMIAASLTITDNRKQTVQFSKPYFFIEEVVVHKSGTQGPKAIEDLKGKKIHLRKSSAAWQSLLAIKKEKNLDFELVATPETEETEARLERVAKGDIELTVVDSHILQVEQNYGTKVNKAFVLPTAKEEPRSIAFAIRPSNPKLAKLVDGFVKKNYRGLKYNIFKKRYFEKTRKHLEYIKGERLDKSGNISKFDKVIKKYAKKYNFDWRLLAAQAFVESGFDPNAKSWVGAKGLFQVMPRTGKSMGFSKLTDPEQGTHAGVKYLNKLIGRFDSDIPFVERIWFALASYNAGLGHVIDARRLARQKGLNQNAWFDNVEKTIKLLSQPKYAKKARYGYCRGSEPAAYVARIRDVYQSYAANTL